MDVVSVSNGYLFKICVIIEIIYYKLFRRGVYMCYVNLVEWGFCFEEI